MNSGAKGGICPARVNIPATMAIHPIGRLKPRSMSRPKQVNEMLTRTNPAVLTVVSSTQDAHRGQHLDAGGFGSLQAGRDESGLRQAADDAKNIADDGRCAGQRDQRPAVAAQGRVQGRDGQDVQDANQGEADPAG